MIPVLGSGFGLYGHLPALVELGHTVGLPERYRASFEARDELRHYRTCVQFVDTDARLLEFAQLAVLARRPSDNETLAYRFVGSEGPATLVIEKPPAPTPAASQRLISALRAAQVRSVVPYLLPYCDWAQAAERALSSGRAFRVDLAWQFFSPTVTPGSWKATESAGGGPLSYYFIHVIALAVAILGKDLTVDHAWRRHDEAAFEIGMKATAGAKEFNAVFRADPKVSRCVCRLDDSEILIADSPFGPLPARGQRDPRIDILKRFYSDKVFGKRDVVTDFRVDLRILDLWAALATR